MLQILMHPKRISSPLVLVLAALALWIACQPVRSANSAPNQANWAMQFKSDPNNPRIAYATAMLLGQFQYLQHPLDTEFSERFFDVYMNSLDPRHENFLQSDLTQFNVYRTNLDNLTTGGRGVADLTPAYVIYERYLQRTGQHTQYVQ